VDARAYFEGIASANSNSRTWGEVSSFFEWTKKDLFKYVRPKDAEDTRTATLSGLSIFAATTPKEAARYKELDLYKKSQLPALFKKVATADDSKSSPEPESN
jgi:hypothetical protein